MKHYVYFLHNLDEDVLLYVGRSNAPQSRWADFMRREGIPAIMTKVVEYDLLKDAQQAELESIASCSPLYNIAFCSGKGRLGIPVSEETRKRLSVPSPQRSRTMLGVEKSSTHRANISKGMKGRPVSEATRRLLSEKISQYHNQRRCVKL